MISATRHHFAIIIKAKAGCNPNGDPGFSNRPRTTFVGDDEHGVISDVCLKRKIRNRVMEIKGDEKGYEVYVSPVGADAKDGATHLMDRFAKRFPEIAGKEVDERQLKQKVCKEWFDVRAFGNLFAGKSTEAEEEAPEGGKKAKKSKDTSTKGVSIAVTGPVTIQRAVSVSPIQVSEMSITKSATGADASKSDTMGTKPLLDAPAVYVAFGGITKQLSEITGFNDADVEVLKQAIQTMFDGDESSARPAGSLCVEKVIWWEYEGAGVGPAKLEATMTVAPDGTVTFSEDEFPGVKRTEIAGW